MDPDAAWFMDDDTPSETVGGTDVSGVSETSVSSVSAPEIPTGPPVPNPYAHLLAVPARGRQYTHWARNKHLQYKYVTKYANVYFDDYVDYINKRQRGICRDVPQPQEWPERVLRLYAIPGERLANDSQYWTTDKNKS